MTDAIETKTHRGLTVNVFHDECGDDPRNWDPLGTMICFHGRYNLGDKHDYNADDYDGFDSMMKAVEKDNGTCVFLPIYMYEHSGIGLSTSNANYPFNCQWDAGRLGFIYVSKKDIRKEYGKAGKVEIEKAEKNMINEVELYGKFVNGECYLFDIEDENEENLECGAGFYDADEALKAGLEAAEYLADEIERMAPTKAREELEANGQLALEIK